MLYRKALRTLQESRMNEVVRELDGIHTSNEKWVSKLYGEVVLPVIHSAPRWVGGPIEDVEPRHAILRRVSDTLLLRKRFELVKQYSPSELPEFVDTLVTSYEEGNVTHEEIVDILRKHTDFPGRDKLEKLSKRLYKAEEERYRLEREHEIARVATELKTKQEIIEMQAIWKEEVLAPIAEAVETIRKEIDNALSSIDDKIVIPEPKTWKDDVKGVGKKVWKLIN